MLIREIIEDITTLNTEPKLGKLPHEEVESVIHQWVNQEDHIELSNGMHVLSGENHGYDDNVALIVDADYKILDHDDDIVELMQQFTAQEIDPSIVETIVEKCWKGYQKKVHENVWAFDAEKALELLKEPLLRGGRDDDPDLSCDMCGGTGCGSGYNDIKNDLARWTEMLNPNNDNRPEHLTNDDIQKKIKKLKILVQKYPNGIPDNIDCSAGMSKKKHREWNKTKEHDAADVLNNIIGDDSFHDMLDDLAPEDDVRPLIMNWLNPEWRAKQRPGLPEYPAVEHVDFAKLYKRARQIYNPLTLVKEDKLVKVEEDLRAWFGKGKKGGAGGGGWDRYNTKGERIGKCGDAKKGEGKPKCLSKSRAASLRAKGGKKAIAAAVRKKRREDPNKNRKGKAKNVSNTTRKS